MFLFAFAFFRQSPAQRALWLDATTSTAQPPADVVGAHTSTYVLIGLRGEAATRFWQLNGSFNGGNGFDDQAGRWLWLNGGAVYGDARKHSGFGFTGSADGLRYTTPFDYGAYTASAAPSVFFGTATSRVTLMPQGTIGMWSATGETGKISVGGASGVFAHSLGSSTLQLTAEAHHANNGSLNGTFSGVGADVFTRSGSFELGAGVRSWHTPLDNEWGYSAYASKNLARNIRIDVQLARSVTDMVLATPASFGASLGVSWRLASRETAPAKAPVARVGAVSGRGRRVRFAIEKPDATRVELSGSFTSWNPLLMQRTGKIFTIEIEIPEGTHQFGFLIDGKDWYVPADAGGLVDDGFGRKNATLVVEGK